MSRTISAFGCKNLFINAAASARGAALVAMLLMVCADGARAQDAADWVLERRPAVFLDCSSCDETFIRQEMTFVDYVRDRESADVHVLVTRVGAGAGGERFTFDLIGLGPFDGQNHSMTYTASASATDDVKRQGMLRTLKVALVPYLMQSSVARQLTLTMDETGDETFGPAEDPWNGWTIEFYGDAWGDMESSQVELDARYGLSVDRVAEQWKIRLRPYFNYNFERFEQEDETITSTSRRDGFDSYVIKSVTPHWSLGLFGDLYSSTFDNVKIRFRVRPGVEYSLFPYREATRRQLTVAYLIGGSSVQYYDTTIFDKTSELLAQHALDTRYEVTQPWGEIRFGIELSQYLHDLSKYRFETGAGVELRLTRGLSVDFGMEIDLVHDQINLQKGQASLEEVLLRRRQLATNYELSASVGFRYRIGSTYNNVVNTRF